MRERSFDRGAAAVGVALAAAPAVYSGVVAAITPVDRLLRAWLGGAIVPGRLGVEPWRLLTGSLLHLDGGHLLPGAALLGVMGYAVAARMGWAAAALVATAGAVGGGLAAAWAAQGWAVGGSAALFGLLGAWAVAARGPAPDGARGVTGRASSGGRRVALWLAAAALWAWWGPGDRAAHVGGLGAGALVGALAMVGGARRAWAGAARVAALLWVMAAVIGGWRATHDAAPTDWRIASGVAHPAGWRAGVPVAPCRAAVGDGLVSVCALEAATPAAVEAALTAAGHAVERAATGDGWPVTARPPGVGVVEVRRPPGGPTIMAHAVSAAALAHRRATLDAVVKLSADAASAGGPGR